MRIQQIVKETGLSKRAVHYYIKEELIRPLTDKSNGYFVFTDEDVKKLMVIRLLRALDISVEDIRNVLEHPKTINYYLTKTLRELSRQKYHIAQQEKSAERILFGLSQEPTIEQLFLQADSAGLPLSKEEPGEILSGIDARMLALYFMGDYMNDLEMTEYRRYLWDKLLSYVASPKNKELIPICRYLYSLDTEKIKEVFAQRNLHMEYISSLTQSTYSVYIELMASTIQSNIRDTAWVSGWKRAYTQYLLPSIAFYDSQANEFMQELSPQFTSYIKNIHICCTGMRKFLDTERGLALFEEMNRTLDGYMDIDSHHHGVLESIISFRADMY